MQMIIQEMKRETLDTSHEYDLDEVIKAKTFIQKVQINTQAKHYKETHTRKFGYMIVHISSDYKEGVRLEWMIYKKGVCLFQSEFRMKFYIVNQSYQNSTSQFAYG